MPGDVLSSATYTGPTGETYTDITGTAQTTPAVNVPRDGHYVGTTRTLLLGTADTLTLPWSATPVPMTVYVRCIDQGMGTEAATGDRVIVSVGSGNNRFTILAHSTGYQLNYRVGGVDHLATDTGGLASSGDVLEFRATLSGTGAATLSHTKNNGVETTPVTLAGATTLGSDAFTRANSTTSLGTADTGGAWTSVGTLAGITNNKGYWISDRSGGNIAYLTVGSLPDTVSVAIATNNIHYWTAGPLLRYVDVSNFLRLTFLNGVALLESRVGGVTTTRGSFTTTLPTTGSASFTASATILSNVVTCYVNGTSVGTYTLSGTEITAYGSSLNVGVAGSSAGTGGTSTTFDNFTATSGSATVAPPGAWDTATLELGSVGGTLQGTFAVVVVIVVAGVVAMTRSRSANKHPIAAGADVTPATIVLSPSNVSQLTTAGPINFTSTVKNAAGSVLTSAQAPVTYTSDTPAVITINSSTGVATPVSAGTAVIRAQTSVSGVYDTSAVTLTAPGATRTLLFPHARFRIIQRWTGATDDAFANAHFDDIYGGTTTTHPNAICVERYAILLTTESNGENDFSGGVWAAPTDYIPVLYVSYAASYATAHSQNVEDYWLHARSGQANNVAGIWSISSAGVILFYYPVPGGGWISSFPYSVGQTVTLSGLSAGNGTYTIASLQKFGITLTGWSSGQLGPTGTVPPSNTHIGTVSTPGDGTLTLANRLQLFGWASWFLFSNFGNANARAMQAQRFADSLTLSSQTVNAFLIDNMASGSNYNDKTVSVEYGVQVYDTNTPPQKIPAPQYMTDMATCLAAIRAEPGVKYLRANSAGYTAANDVKVANAAGGIHGETLLSLYPYDQTALNYVIARVAAGVDVEYSNGDTYTVSGGVATMGVASSYTPGNYPTKTARGQMSLYAEYLMAVDASYTAPDGSTQKHCICDITNGFAVNQGPLSALIPVAYEYNVGQPTGAMTQLLRTDPAGGAIRTLTRSFSLDGGTTLSAFVVYNHNVNGQSNYGENSLVTTNLPTPPTGDAWFMLNWDGTLGTTPLTSISSRRSEGVIVVAQPSGVLAQRADTFVDSIGTNIHMDAAPYNAHFSDWVIPSVLNLGMRKVRSGSFGAGADPPINETSLLASEAGTGFTLVTNPGAAYTDQSVQDYMLAHVDPAIVDCLEGPNEVDNNNAQWGGLSAYGTNVQSFMGALKTDIANNAIATIRAIPISTPSVTSSSGASGLGDCSGFATFGTVHPYPLNGQEPGSQLAADVANVKPVFASLGKYIVTETGYQTAPNATSPSYEIGQGVSEAVHAKYLPRLWAEYFKQGVTRTFNYELFDDGIDLTNGESNFGLYRADNTPKPVVGSIKNLIAILGEKAWTAPSAVLGSAYVDDTFTRANASGWGNATSGSDTNKTWVDGDGAEASHWLIVSNAGVAIAASQIRNIIGDSHTGDVEYFIQLRNVKASYSNLFRIYGRWVDLTHNYSLDFNPGVGQQLSINKNAASTLAGVTATKYTTMTNPNLRFRIRTIGSDVYLYGKAWDSAGAEPTTWDVTAIDKAPASGYLAGATAVWCDNNSSGQSMQLTRFTASPVTVTPGSYSSLGSLTLGRLAYTLTGTTANVQDLLLQKADGSFYLVLWNRVQCWNQSSKQDITNAPASITISTTATRVWTTYQPSASASGTVVGTGVTSVTVSVPDEIFIVKIV